ncbi:MAG: response regulator [Oscillospiraceae bacterium]|jgi:putative two-component system response regulator|nr:response regulator [Oscillospiraceae bacterium]
MDKKKKTIFLVDDNVTNLNIGKDILTEKYNVVTIPSARKMFDMLLRIIPDLILLDIEMPELNGYEAIKLLKSNEATCDIPVIFLTVLGDSSSELAGLTLGAVDYISKPFSPQLLAKRIEVHMTIESQKEKLKNYNENLLGMVHEKTKTVMDLQNAILRTIAELVECRDYTTGGHIERTQNYLQILIDALGKSGLYKSEIKDWNIDFFLQSSQLHDVGKIGVKDSILNKPDKLTAEEFDEMKTHTTFGVEVIEKIQKSTVEEAFLEHAKIFAGTHHEKWDGTGYPKGLSGRDIPLQGRLMAIADVYDALISERPYKKAFSHEDAVKIIANGKGTHFDPMLVDVFMQNEREFKRVANEVK